ARGAARRGAQRRGAAGARRGRAQAGRRAVRPRPLALAPPAALRGAHRMSVPLVTIGVVSYNRLHYLRALLESARECVSYPSVQWIVVDGNSVEPGLRKYVQSLEFVQHKVFADCTHPEAMNL